MRNEIITKASDSKTMEIISGRIQIQDVIGIETTSCKVCDRYQSGNPCTCKDYEPLKVGDVMYSSWGYDQTNIDYYVVTRRTKCTVTLAPINSIVVENVAWAHDKVIADMEHAKWMIDHEHHAQSTTDNSCLNNKRIKWDGTKHAQVKIAHSQYAWVDDGTPKSRTSYA